MEQLVPLMRDAIAEGRYLDAIRYARREGLMFGTARTMADEIRDGAPWYRPQLYPSPKRRR